MQFTSKFLRTTCLLVLGTITVGATCLYLAGPFRGESVSGNSLTVQSYSCPMHPQIADIKASQCPKCGMKLVLGGEVAEEAKPAADAHGCCSSKSKTQTMAQLPAGHPPVAGMTVAAAETSPSSSQCAMGTKGGEGHACEMERQ